ncbi:MAG: hypothetical protein AAB870_02225 [Patescibacteria group bacterium]
MSRNSYSERVEVNILKNIIVVWRKEMKKLMILVAIVLMFFGKNAWALPKHIELTESHTLVGEYVEYTVQYRIKGFKPSVKPGEIYLIQMTASTVFKDGVTIPFSNKKIIKEEKGKVVWQFYALGNTKDGIHLSVVAVDQNLKELHTLKTIKLDPMRDWVALKVF